MIKNSKSRRKFIQKCLAANAFLFGGGWIMSSCGSKSSEETVDETMEEVVSGDPCADLSGLSESDLAQREQLGYVKKTPIPEEFCGNCQLYIPPKTDSDCGGCMLFKGPVYKEAYCTYWAPQI
ncbi:MAG TPA: high-potential iron-sulfur protein [Cyclobacteriaceae bacterium]|nr:high-potential iron-sulfur protein [Cyclobacteriaceae bacterium]